MEKQSRACVEIVTVKPPAFMAVFPDAIRRTRGAIEIHSSGQRIHPCLGFGFRKTWRIVSVAVLGQQNDCSILRIDTLVSLVVACGG
jgi:hypothetical protein